MVSISGCDTVRTVLGVARRRGTTDGAPHAERLVAASGTDPAGSGPLLSGVHRSGAPPATVAGRRCRVPAPVWNHTGEWARGWRSSRPRLTSRRPDRVTDTRCRCTRVSTCPASTRPNDSWSISGARQASAHPDPNEFRVFITRSGWCGRSAGSRVCLSVRSRRRSGRAGRQRRRGPRRRRS